MSELVEAARRYPSSQVYVVAYADPEDVKGKREGVLDLSERLMIAMGRYLAGRGIDASRISGKGLGANPKLGRAAVVSLDVIGTPPTVLLSERELAERAAAVNVPERMPSENRTFKDVGGKPDYRIGVGDTVGISNALVVGAQFWTAVVRPLGTISFDLVQDVPVAGLTVAEAESLLRNIMKRYYKNPRITVAVSGFGGRSVTLVGPAGSRAIPLAGRTTILDFIGQQQIVAPLGPAISGTVTVAVPDLRKIQIYRGTREYTANYYRLVIEHDWKENFILDDGDIVYLPSFGETGEYVMVLGAVRAPGLLATGSKLTAAQAIILAGGATDTGYLPHARILRGGLDSAEVIPADVDLVLEKGDLRANKTLQGGDILYVPTTRISDWNQFIKDISPTLELASVPLRYWTYFHFFFRRNAFTTP